MLTNLRNANNVDRTVRVAVGLALLAYAAFAHAWIGLLGIIPLATGLVGFCPLYRLFGRSTCHT